MKQKNQNLLQQLLNGVLILAVIGMLGWLSVRFSVKQDWTANKRNTLTQASQLQLAAMKDPIHFIAFAYPGAEERGTVQFYVDQYKRFKKDVSLEFVDPSSNPQKVKEYNVSFAGEVVLEYQGRKENLRTISEQVITSTLQRLTYTGEKWVVFLEGHGERSTSDQQDQNAFGHFAAVLKDKGLNVQPLNLVKTPKIPDNTAVLVIASPTTTLFEGEIRLIDEYVRKGGNLLWLADPGNKPGIDAVASTLGITWQDGYAVFPEYELLGTGHPGIFAAIGYPPNPVTTGLNQVTLFPLVRSLTSKGDSGWQVQPMLVSSEEAWLETSPITDKAVTKDTTKGDIAGPLTIGATLTRDVADEAPAAATADKKADTGGAAKDEAKDGKDAKDAGKDPKPEAAASENKPAAKHQQRVVLVGDADFIANAGLPQYGNQQLGINIIQWLASRDAQLNIDVPKAPDTDLFLPQWALVVLVGGFTVVLPLLLLGIGVTRWVVRRRR